MQEEVKQKFKKGDAVRFQGSIWEVVGVAGGPLAGYMYQLRGMGHIEAAADEKDMEQVPEGAL
jgi:hypothetical protein